MELGDIDPETAIGDFPGIAAFVEFVFDGVEESHASYDDAGGILFEYSVIYYLLKTRPNQQAEVMDFIAKWEEGIPLIFASCGGLFIKEEEEGELFSLMGSAVIKGDHKRVGRLHNKIKKHKEGVAVLLNRKSERAFNVGKFFNEILVRQEDPELRTVVEVWEEVAGVFSGDLPKYVIDGLSVPRDYKKCIKSVYGVVEKIRKERGNNHQCSTCSGVLKGPKKVSSRNYSYL